MLYKLYLIHKDSEPEIAEQYASQLKKEHPGSTFAKILINPNYLAESSQVIQRQQELYKVAYHHFEEGEFIEYTEASKGQRFLNYLIDYFIMYFVVAYGTSYILMQILLAAYNSVNKPHDNRNCSKGKHQQRDISR